MVRFFSSEWLWLLTFLPFIALRRVRPADVAAVDYPNTHLVRTFSGVRRGRSGAWLTTQLTLAGLALLIVGMARPQIGSTIAPIPTGGIDIMLLLDVSDSMRSLDFQLDGKPASRINVVKSTVSKFIQARPNDRIGLSLFASVPYLVSPPTLDHVWLRQHFERVQIGAADHRTAIGSAIAAGVDRLHDQSARSKVIVLLTAGQDNARVSPLSAAQAAHALGIRVYTISIGVRGDAPYPITDARADSHIVLRAVDVDERALQQIATTTGAQFYRATNAEALDHIYTDIDRLERTTHAPKSYEQWQDLYGWFLIPGLLILCVTIVLQQGFWRGLPI